MGWIDEQDFMEDREEEDDESFGGSTRCMFCDTMIFWSLGHWFETVTGDRHNCRVATADEFPD